nr:biosynthetic arginine decarboxylase [Petrimonas sp.]
MRKWRIEDSEELYNIDGWGNGYFSINEKGNVQVTPRKKPGGAVDLNELMRELYLRDVSAPVLVRFPQILDNRIEKISTCFEIAAKEYGYASQNYIVYPIKVNQMRQVVEEIVTYGKRFNIGLEAGSKPELHAVLAINTSEDSIIICNGYKDESYIELALLAKKMGKEVFIVIEKLNELELTIEIAKRLKVKPNIGIRIKLASSGSGKWEESGGDGSKFGLNSSELLEALDLFKKHKMTDCFRLIHFHIGSQITKIRRVKTALREASQFYVQLHLLGFNVEFVDIGGGLGVDYDGTRSSYSENSINYSIQEYVNDSVFSFVDAANKNEIPHPKIITESGRALTAHHSVLIFEVLETATLPEWGEEVEIQENDHELVKELYKIWDNLSQTRMLEAWHDAQQIREESLDLFSLGMLELKTRAQVEQLYFSIIREINFTINRTKHAPEELRQLSSLLPDKYFCNFSLFQSLPDSWAIDQVFPIIPIHRLDEKPERTATLQDITCDSDGKIASYTAQGGFHQSFIP